MRREVSIRGLAKKQSAEIKSRGSIQIPLGKQDPSAHLDRRRLLPAVAHEKICGGDTQEALRRINPLLPSSGGGSGRKVKGEGYGGSHGNPIRLKKSSSLSAGCGSRRVFRAEKGRKGATVYL